MKIKISSENTLVQRLLLKVASNSWMFFVLKHEMVKFALICFMSDAQAYTIYFALPILLYK